MPGAIAGILKAPFDILADKLRGYIGLTMDLFERPDKVLAACQALMPHLMHVAHTTADPTGAVPIGFWMHRGCVPFVTPDQFDRFYWPTLKPIIEELWARGHQVLFYAEGDWNAHLDSFAELPDRSIVFHADRADIFEIHRKLGHKFCISGGVPNVLLAMGTPEEVREYCRKIIDGVARDGRYIMDASAIIQNDAKPENIRAMTDFTREYGVYSGPNTFADDASGAIAVAKPTGQVGAFVHPTPGAPAPGVCVPWSAKRTELPEITGDESLLRKIWEDVDSLAYTYIWQCLLSF
jgi:uroporphyrinogen-III decarboxylase